MLFFKRIMKLAEGTPAPSERRRAPRYSVGAEFPLKAVLNLAGRDEFGNPLQSSGGDGWNWGGRLVDLSSSGARMQLPPAALTARGDACHLNLKLDHYHLVIPGRITHLREQRDCMLLGLALAPVEAETRHAYQQLLDLVALGASLKAAKAAKIDDSGFLAEQYGGDHGSQLTVWRQSAPHHIVAFAFQLKNWLVRGRETKPGLEYFAAAPDQPTRPVAPAQGAEIHRLFRWVVPNLARTVPADARAFLQKYSA